MVEKYAMSPNDLRGHEARVISEAWWTLDRWHGHFIINHKTHYLTNVKCVLACFLTVL